MTRRSPGVLLLVSALVLSLSACGSSTWLFRIRVGEDGGKLGLQLDTLKIQHVSDDVEYLDSIGRQKIAEVIKRAEIAESNAKNEANMVAAERKSEGEIAR